MGNQLGDALILFGSEFELHVRSNFLKFVKQFLGRCTEDVMNFVDLVKLILAWEQRVQGQDLEEDATDSPNIHFVAVVAVCHEAFGGSVPPSGDVLGERRLIVEAPATAEISKLNRFLRK